MHHAITWAQARRPIAARAAFGHHVAVTPGEGHIERAAFGARGLVRADDLLRLRRQITAEGWLLFLAAPALVFFSERQQSQISQIADSFALDACFGKFGLIKR